ncbi:MAG: TolB family protein, partial [Pyrinomonadaceae bacterium]
MRQIFLAVIFSIFAFVSFNGQTNPVFDFDEMMKIKRVGDPQLSPDGSMVAFTTGEVKFDANKTNTQIYTVSIDGSNLKQLTKGDASNNSPRWSPDGTKIAYTTGGQIWTMDADGDDKKQITKLSSGAGNPVWSPDGKLIAFVTDVFPECTTDDCNKLKDETAENSKVKAHVTERLLFKHWNEWRDTKRTHVFVVASNGGEARDLTFGDFDAPPYGASSGVDYAFSPDSKEIAYLRNPDKIEAISTNSDIYIRPVAGNAASKNITVLNKGYDASPVYTYDGKYILYRSQATEAFEADRWRIMRYDRKTGEIVELTRGFDLQVDEMTLAPNSETIYFTAGQRGTSPIFSVPVEPDFRLKIATQVKQILNENTSSNLNVSKDGKTLV